MGIDQWLVYFAAFFIDILERSYKVIVSSDFRKFVDCRATLKNNLCLIRIKKENIVATVWLKLFLRWPSITWLINPSKGSSKMNNNLFRKTFLSYTMNSQQNKAFVSAQNTSTNIPIERNNLRVVNLTDCSRSMSRHKRDRLWGRASVFTSRNIRGQGPRPLGPWAATGPRPDRVGFRD